MYVLIFGVREVDVIMKMDALRRILMATTV